MLILLYLLSVFTLGHAADLCAVYDPFKVQPDNNKFQIGGSFPLHEADCQKLKPDTVQEIVAIQWALTHWNQNPNNFNAKLGLYAGDTCSRSREALSQSLRFLDSVGYHEPAECRKEGPGAKLLGVIAPKDYNSSLSLGRLLQLADVPIAAYSAAAANALQQLQVNNIVATTPTISVYVEVLARVMAQLRSNLVTIVEDGSNPDVVQRVINQLKSADLFVSDILPAEHPLLAQMIDDTDASIVVSILGKEQLKEMISRPTISALEKVWISLPIDGEALDQEEQEIVLPDEAKLELISIQPRFVELPQFRDYFLRVLKNNYQSYSLLTSYVQQVYNCKNETCDLDKNEMIEKYEQARTTEAAIRMTYAFAAAGAKLGSDPVKMATCAHPDPDCTALILAELESLDYEFSINDPSELTGESLHFYRGKDGVLLSSGMVVDAIELVMDPQQGALSYKLLEYRTGKRPVVVSSSLRPQDSRIRSICAPYRPFCGQCPNVATVSGDKHFLSIPRHYPLYLSGLFNMHSGSNCQSMKNSDISMPMAFVHTVWTFKQRFPQLALLKNLDFGALLVDTCTSGKQAMETVVRSETQCFRFNQAGRNITIVPGSVFGYISALQGDSQQALKGYFGSGDTDAALVAVDPEHSTGRDFFTALPSAKSQALALLRFLNRMQWQFVTVALSEQDPSSLAAFRQFERLALDRGVCLAEVINLSTLHPNHALPSNTNVTIVFANGRDAAGYLSLGLRTNHQQVHILMGDAHDFYLHDEENRDKMIGTLSIQPKDILYADFREWLQTTTPLTLPEMWFWNFIEDRYQCALSQKSKIIYGKMCTGDEVLDVQGLGRMTRAGYLSRGVERFLFAMDAVYKRLCPQQNGLCPEFYSNGRRSILDQLKKAAVEDDVDIYEFMPDKGGVARYHLIGNYSQVGGLRLSALYKSFGPETTVTSRCQPPMCKCFLDGDFFQRPLDAFVNVESPETLDSASYVRKQPAYGADRVQYQSILEHLSSGEWRQHTHNFVLLGVITLLTVSAFAVLILVLVKLYLRVVKGNQSLGITLLIGIVILYITAYFFVFDATDSVCRARVILHGLGYTLCFGVMITKATQLRNAETLGFANAIHISFWNYWLLMFFIVGVQLALSVRWMAEPFMSTWSVSDDVSKMVCSFGRNEFVLSNAYVIILIVLALFINSRNRNIKRNYKETKWLFLSAVACSLLWVAWIGAYFMVPYDWKESVVALELISCATVLLAFLFGPKIYILLSYEPVVVEFKPENKGKDLPIGLFEKDDDLPSMRAVSPASSTESTPSSLGSQRSGNSAIERERGPVPPSGSSSGNYSDDQSPIFHTVMRKKKAVRRSNSEHESRNNTVQRLPEVPVIRTTPTKVESYREQASPRDMLP